MVKVTSRQLSLINSIISADGYISGNDLAKITQISVKTIQREIKSINNFLKPYNCEIISKRSCGYKIEYQSIKDYEVLKTALQENDCRFIYTLEENRIYWLIKKLSFLYIDGDKESIKLEELSDELFISISTLKNDLKVVKQILNRYQLNLVRNGNEGVHISGEESKFRHFLSDYILHKLKPEKSDTIFNLIDEKVSESIKRIIVDIINKYDLNITDLGFNNLFNHIIITITRIKNNKIIENEEIENIPVNDIEYEASINLCMKIFNLVNIEFPNTEIIYIYHHLKSQNKLFKDDNYSLDKSDDKNLDIIKKALKEIYLQIGIDFTKDEILENGLLIHLKSALNRIKHRMKIRNSFLHDIKKNYILAYEVASFFSKIINEDMSIDIDENEVGYLALHFGGALERMNIRKDRFKVILICASGMGTSILLKSKLANRFGSKIDICGIYPSYKLEELNFSDIDLIISTIRLEYNNIPIINISPILNDADMNKINNFISNGSEKFNFDLKSYFKQDLFIPDLDIKNHLKVIEYMSQNMYKLGYIDKVMKNSYLEREMLSSTEIGNMVAIPHAIVGKVNRPGISVAILKEPIQWVYSKVQLVIMIAIDKKMLLEHEKIFLDIYEQVNEVHKVKKIIDKKDINYIKNNIRGGNYYEKNSSSMWSWNSNFNSCNTKVKSRV